MISRSDLPVGFLAAQIVHAAGESVQGKVEPGTNAVVLDAQTEPRLAAIASALALAKIPHVVIVEPDAPWNGAMTAIGISPLADRSALRRIVSSLPLYGKEASRKVA